MSWDRNLGDEPPPAWRDRPPDVLVPIDEDAPVSGHHAPREAGPSAAEAPEHDWLAAEAILMPVLRPVGTTGTRLAGIDPERLATEGMKTHASPILDDGPAGLAIGYVLRAGSFDVHVNADHLLEWGATPDELRAAAMANLARWSETAPWTEESSGARRIISSASGGGGDATRILLPETRAHLAAVLGDGARVLVGVPERDLLVAGALRPGDDEFAVLFAEFVRDNAAGSDQPLDRRVHEIVGGELLLFEA
ncbi:MAG TPA: hypothetical protein VLS28_10305 [Candidatus Sulfomarinibacteraceae bacterium]|nr:hypothetical protein [Candidatus Sulfomarinibacteraceae bacterium]